jgi:AsmA protein
MRWIIRIAAFIAIVVVLGLGALVAVPTERVAGVVADRLSAATGREVAMEGELRPTLFPSLGIRVGDVSVGNPDWVDAGPMIAAERLDVSVEWAPLLRGEIRLDRAEFVSPQITLVRAADGRVSWDFAATDSTSDAPATTTETPDAAAATDQPFLVGFDRAVISNGALRWIDQATGNAVTLTDLDAILSLPSGDSRASLEATANVDGRPFEVALSVDGAAPLLAGAVRPAAAELSWTGGQATFEGRLSLTPALDGVVAFEATDLGPLVALAGAAMPELPSGAGRDRIAANGQITLTDAGSVHLREGTITLDDNMLGVALDMVPGEDRPMIRGTVSGGVLSFMPSGGGGAAGAGATDGSADATGWPSDTIDVSGLFATDAEISLRFGGIELDGARLGAIEVNAMLDQGRLVSEIGRIDAYGGRLAGRFVVNGRNGLSVGGDLILTEVALAPLLDEFVGYDRLEGTGSASLQFLGVGNDIATIMSSLDGQGDFAFGAGALLGFDLAGMIRNFDASFQGDGARTVYDSITANFVISDGVLQNDDLLLDAPWGGVEGAGEVDLGGQTVDYRVIPGVMRDAAGEAGIAVPILVTGPWSNLRFRPDLEFLAEQEFLEQRDRLAADAEARLAEEQDRLEEDLRNRANDLLGTDIEAGDGREEIEDALQDRLSEETQNVLSRILGGGGQEASE